MHRGGNTFQIRASRYNQLANKGRILILRASDLLTRQSRVATVIESLLRGPMRISAPGDCNHAFRQSSGALAMHGTAYVINDRGRQFGIRNAYHRSSLKIAD